MWPISYKKVIESSEKEAYTLLFPTVAPEWMNLRGSKFPLYVSLEFSVIRVNKAMMWLTIFTFAKRSL
jgi:hypothetical protein